MPKAFGAQKWSQRVGPGRKRVLGFETEEYFGCPLCPQGAVTVVRTQVRGVTLGCLTCGLHFTMTWHRLAQATRRLVNEEEDGWRESGRWRHLAEIAEAMAPEETRGRKKARSPAW